MLQPHQQRVIDERKDLEEKRCKLMDFMDSNVFLNLPEKEREALRDQFKAMRNYSDILMRRIMMFGREDTTLVDWIELMPTACSLSVLRCEENLFHLAFEFSSGKRIQVSMEKTFREAFDKLVAEFNK